MRRLLIVVVVGLMACSRWARDPNFGSLPTDQRTFHFRHNIEVLAVSNGMRVALVHDDRSNVVTVDLRYAAGAAEDPIGRTGMAHLVEHLVFELRAAPGGPTLGEELSELTLYQNAFTSWDATHFMETLPAANLEAVLALEGRRMRAPCDELDEATFRREVDVVRAEERTRYSPSSAAAYRVMAAVYGEGHPYARPLGSDEITTVTRDEVCAFIEANYTPDRAYLVITGPFQPATVGPLITRSFSGVARRAGPRKTIPGPQLDGEVSRHPAPVERPTAQVFLPYPAWGLDGTVSWAVARRALAAALSTADDELPWITATAVYTQGGDRRPVLVAEVTVTSADQLEAAAQEVFARAAGLDTVLAPALLRDLTSSMTLDYVDSWDDLDNRGAWLASFLQYAGHNTFMLNEMKSLADAKWTEELKAIAKGLVPARSHVAFLTPSGGAATRLSAAIPTASHDLVPWRAPVDPAAADQPVELETAPARRTVETYALANGLKVVLAPDRDSPIVDARLVFPVGRAHEPADRPHLATAAAGLLELDEEGFYERPMLDKLEWALRLGTSIDEDVGATSTMFTSRGTATWGDWHLWVLSWWLDQGTYNASTLRELHRHARALARDEDADLDEVTGAVWSRLYGEGHAYATPPPLVGASYLRIEAGDLKRWKAQHFRARGATLVVSGDFELATMKRNIEALFGPWDGGAPAPLPSIAPTRPATGPSWFAVEEPNALQTRVFVGFASGSDQEADEPARQVLLEMLREELRVVREGMGASYGVEVGYAGGPAGDALMISTQVDETRTAEVVERILAVLDRLGDDAAGQRETFVRARKKALARSIAQSGGATSVADELAAAADRGHGPDHAQLIATRMSALTPAELGTVATADLDPARRVVLVRGKRAAVEATFTRLAITPEKLKGRAQAAAEQAARRPKPAPGDAPATTAGPTRGEARLSIGSPYAVVGPDTKGYFLDDRRLSLDEFLRIGGGGDLRARMTARRWTKRGMFWGGLAAIAGGAALAYTAGECDGSFPTAQAKRACEDARDGRKTTGQLLAGVGVVLVFTQTQIGKGLPTDEELRAVAERYNRRPIAKAAVSVAPVVMPGGGGLILSGGF